MIIDDDTRIQSVEESKKLPNFVICRITRAEIPSSLSLNVIIAKINNEICILELIALVKPISRILMP